MKKAFLGIVILFALSGCGASNDSNTKNSASVDSNESTAISSTTMQKQKRKSESSKIIDPLNKKIFSTFEKRNLPMFSTVSTGNFEISPEEANSFDPNLPIAGGIAFYTEDVDNGFEYGITINTFSSTEEMDRMFEMVTTKDERRVNEFRASKNPNIKSVLYAADLMNEDVFNSYKSAFETIK